MIMPLKINLHCRYCHQKGINLKYLTALMFILLPLSSFSEESNVRHLDDFDTVELFEEHLLAKRNSCLDRSSGGSRSSVCLTEYSNAWDTELSYFYKLLRNKLSDQEKQDLKDAQLAWIQYRDKTIDVNSLILDKKYANKHGTMYHAMRAKDAAGAITPIIKNRTILFKNWLDTINKL